jgi:hypothetical protein
MDKTVLDLYTDYLISSFGQTTATGLVALLGATLSHDQISRFLNAPEATAADLWRLVKPFQNRPGYPRHKKEFSPLDNEP